MGIVTQFNEGVALQNAKLFDHQVNGFAGIDFQSNNLQLGEMLEVVDALKRCQTAAILFTVITDSIDAICRKFERIETLRRIDDRIAAMIPGYHLEGPWFSREAGYFGAHSLEKVGTPRLEDYRKIRDAAGGNLKMITLAPELEGAIPLIEAARSDGIRIGLGHTNASDSAIDEAIKAGASMATHLGNAVPLLEHRHDNVMQRLLSRDELIACFIPDGIHLPPFVLKNFYRAKPEKKVFFTTDCMSAAGAPSGVYPLAHHMLKVGDDRVVRLPGDGRFAGSSLTMDLGLKNVVDWLGLDAATAISLCSTLPAEHFGIDLNSCII